MKQGDDVTSHEDAGDLAPLVRRQRWLLVIATSAAVLSLAGLGVSTLIKSPADVAAATKPPSPTTLTAAVERRVLTRTLTLRGTVQPAVTVDVTPTSVSAGGTGGNSRMVVTGVRARPGDSVNAGQVLVEVSGRPVIALPGAIPAYRDLRPGAKGADIAQLQDALRALHHADTDTRGYFGPGTKRALGELYSDIGYEAAITGQQDEEAIKAAKKQLRSAKDALAQAPAGTNVDALRQDVTDAEQSVAQLEERSGVMLPLSEVAFISGLPAHVVQSTAVVGGEVHAPLLSVSVGDLVVAAEVTPGDKQLLKAGMKTQVDADSLGADATAGGTVTSVGDRPSTGQSGDGQNSGSGSNGQNSGSSGQGSGSVGPLHYSVAVAFAAQPPREWLGEQVRVVIELASSATEVLTVPVSAVFADMQGKSTVLRTGADGTQQRVVVQAGLSGDGFVEVTPVDGRLDAGDRVLVGKPDDPPAQQDTSAKAKTEGTATSQGPP
jgi:HlyD family secretion protein